MLMPSTVIQDATVHFTTVVSLTLWLEHSQLMIKQSLPLLSLWLESVSPTDRHGRDALDFSSCEQLVCCPTHIAGNRLDLVMTDVPDIVDVFVGTPL